MDVKTAFVNAEVDRDVYVSLPPGYRHPGGGNPAQKCLELKRALYGLPQSPLLWNRKFTNWLLERGFTRSEFDPCYFIWRTVGPSGKSEELHLIEGTAVFPTTTDSQ